MKQKKKYNNFNVINVLIPRRRYLYFDVEAGLAWSDDPESYMPAVA
jgi:hypothetical protein